MHANNSSSFGAGDSVAMSRSSQVLRSSMMLESAGSAQSRGRFACCTNCWNSSAMKIIKLLMKKTIRSVVWKALLIIFSIYLLFGSQIRHLFIPSSMDAAFDIISLVVFGFFVLDMIIRMMIYPNYFSISCCNTSGANGGNDVQTGCVLGSFVFWCDLVSTITLLYDISWINEGEYNVKEVKIQLNEFGSPVSTPLKTYASMCVGRLDF